MADRKVTEQEFIGDNTMSSMPMPQVNITAGGEIPVNEPNKEKLLEHTGLCKHHIEK
jgi:hypothetical protein